VKETHVESKLVVKELADYLGVSLKFVYQMRHCGFKMDGDFKDNQTTTARAAVAWIEQEDFRLVNGVGLTKNSSGSLP
jgi:hypothetical protein